MEIKVMSYNVQHFENFKTGEIDFDSYSEYIKNADIIGLNEVRGEYKSTAAPSQAETIAAKTGYNLYYAEAIQFDGKDSYGNALLSKYPIIRTEKFPIPSPPPEDFPDYWVEDRCLLKAEIDVCGTIVNVFVIHFGLSPVEAQRAADAVKKYVKGEKVILMGDFNLTPEKPIIADIRKMLNDTADKFDEAKLSFPSDKPDRKIDYMLVSDDIKIISADIPDKVLSDHRPYISVLDI